MKEINRYIDASVLKPELSRSVVENAIAECLKYNVKSVCVRPCDIDLAVKMCENTDSVAICVLGFPHGVVLSESKASEAELYVKKGVKEIDMVVNYGFIRSRMWEDVEADILAVSRITKPAGVILKVILETSMLNIDEIKKATEIAIKAEADYVKSSTGFTGEGATEEVIKAMLESSSGKIKVKASGGIRDYNKAEFFFKMGCERLAVNYISLESVCTKTV